ncbi:MAG: hypothetical protein ACI9XU_000531 [Arenicella sp.]|jgi:hypothetical protein
MRIILLLMLISFSNFSVAGIKKCQDLDGNWHYGDSAVKSCENSKITTLTKRGFIDAEQSPPKTRLQKLEELEHAELLLKNEAQEKAIIDDRLRILSIYETENDIDRLRDSQLNSVESKIDVHGAYIKGMKSRIARNEAKLSQLKTAPAIKEMNNKIAQAKIRMADSVAERKELFANREEIILRFAKEKEMYLKLKAQRR